jgi:hypothetical protein
VKINNFKVWLFISATLIFCIFTFITLIAAAAVEKGTDGNSPTTQAIAKLYYIFRFPTHNLFFSFMDGSFFFLGLGINCMLYGFLTERIVSIFRSKN